MTDKTVLNTIEQTENKPVDGTENTETNKERLFTQKELEEIISERLKRERKTTGALNDVKRLLKTAGQKGLVKGNSYCEMAEDFCKKLGGEQCGLPKETLDAEGEFQNLEVPDNNLSKAEAAADDKEELLCQDKTVFEQKESITEVSNEALEFAGTLKTLREKFSEQDLGYLLSSGLFESFAKGRQGNLMDVFSDFCEFMSNISQNKKSGVYYDDKEEMLDGNYDDGFSSTAFSSHSSTASSYEDGLTKQQMDIAKSAGMSYREYAQLLDSIPKNKTKKSY